MPGEDQGVVLGILGNQLGAVAEVQVLVSEPRRHDDPGGIVRVGRLRGELRDVGARVVRVAASNPLVSHGQAVHGERGDVAHPHAHGGGWDCQPYSGITNARRT